MYIGIDLGGTKTEIVVLDAAGGERLRFRRPSPHGDYDATLDLLRRLIITAERVHGPAASVGIGAPGALVPSTGRMQNCNSTWLNGRPLQADLERLCQRPIALANDADCFALAEAVDGAGAGFDTVFGVILGTGVGGGIVSHRRLLAGPNAIAGEWGHVRMPELVEAPAGIRQRLDSLPSRPCYCGRSDCIETWLSGPGLALSGRQLGEQVATAEALVEAAEAGSPAAMAALDLYAWQLAAALSLVINVLDPHCIVLGGGLSNLHSLYTRVPARWGRFVFSATVRTPLRPPRHGDSAGVRGAAWLGRDAAQRRAASGTGNR